ncbi:MAG: hypothetical protein LRY20_01460 [Acholeplasmataceae bacterium]|nr:hypothetical protein [Acholeplasmataceae bacterium]
MKDKRELIKKLAEQYLKEGFTRAYVDGQQITLEEMPETR